jgi:hypothetical protein
VTLVHEADVDGVRCFWVKTDRPTLSASLMFRQGLADEPAVESGWLHLLEHLALDGKGGGALSINGSVSLLNTTFDAHGPADLVAAHLTAVSRWLRDPDLSRLSHERGVLAAEASTRGGAGLRAIGWRYGARGPGVLNLDEPGLGRASEESLRDRARRVFTRGNAVLVLDGPPPEGLVLDLHEGLLLPPTVAVPCDDTLPAVYHEQAGVILSGVVDRSTDAVLLPYVLERMLRDRLRHEAGAAYAPWADYQSVDADHAVVLAGSDVSQKMAPDVFAEVARMAHTIRDNGLPPGIVEEAVELRVQAINDPYGTMGLAYAAGSYVLAGKEPLTFEEIVAQHRAVNAFTMQSAAWAFTQSLLIGAPGETTALGAWPVLTPPSYLPRKGAQKFKHRNWPASADELWIDDDILHVSYDRQPRSIRFDMVEMMYVFDDGARYLVDRNGWGVAIDPADWSDGTHAVKVIDEIVDDGVRCPAPPREVAAPRRMPAAKRWWGGLRRAHFGGDLFGGVSWWVLLPALLIVSRILAELAQNH